LRQWDKVLFTDETKINLFSSDGRIRVWREPKRRLSVENCLPTVKHGGGGVTMWGCMSSKGVGKLVFIDGTMDRYSYKRILAENLASSCEILDLPEDFIFQQDNDPKHKSKYVQEFFTENGINVLDWPSQSPDLNPIEHLWDHVKREVRKRSPKNIRELREKIMEIWNEITPDLCKRLVYSMPKRIEEVVRAKGGPTSF
jgi:DDE superfamily endonuclease